jgi:hypothetical protein
LKALKICRERNIVISEDMAEALIPENSSNPKEAIRQIADILLAQKSYILACKKLMQVSNFLLLRLEPTFAN